MLFPSHLCGWDTTGRCCLAGEETVEVMSGLKDSTVARNVGLGAQYIE